MDLILDEYKKTITLKEKEEGYYDRDTGRYVEGTETLVEFKGAVLPLSNDDFVKNPNAGYTSDAKKLYTSKVLENGQKVVVATEEYMVDAELKYPFIDDDFKRYYLRRVGDVKW